MKAKSMKLRTLITLYALWKHTDKDHRLNTQKLNKYLKPYRLDCTGRVLSDTVRIMKEYGLDVRTRGSWDNAGVWLDGRPLQDDVLDKLIFAIATNPYLPKEEEANILSSLLPLVTVYQEEKLLNAHSAFLRSDKSSANERLQGIYSVIQQAITSKRRVIYKIEYVQYDKETNEPKPRLDAGTLFTPKCIYQTAEKLYMFGYNHPDKKIDAVDLNSVANIKLAFKHKNGNEENQRMVERLLEEAEPKNYIPEEKEDILYSGPIVFYCRGQYVGEIYRRFGAPSAPLKKDPRCRVTYPLQEARVCPETLFWLASIPEHGIRIQGPQEVRNAVCGYLERLGNTLVDARLPTRQALEAREKKRSR